MEILVSGNEATGNYIHESFNIFIDHCSDIAGTYFIFIATSPQTPFEGKETKTTFVEIYTFSKQGLLQNNIMNKKEDLLVIFYDNNLFLFVCR